MRGPGVAKAPAWERWGWMVESVAERHGVSVGDIIGRIGTREVTRARHDLMTCMWGSGCGYAEIGRLLGRDHSSVIYAVRRAL